MIPPLHLVTRRDDGRWTRGTEVLEFVIRRSNRTHSARVHIFIGTHASSSVCGKLKRGKKGQRITQRFPLQEIICEKCNYSGSFRHITEGITA